MRTVIAVVGPSRPSPEEEITAEKVGELIAREGWVLVTGGLGGVMEKASSGARKAGGLVLGILPGSSPEEANPYVDIPLPTGMGELRNFLVVAVSQGVVAVGTSPGTLVEIAVARLLRKPLAALHVPAGWPEEEIASTPDEALEILRKRL